MKRVLIVAAFALCTVFMGNVAQAQSKVGYVNFSELVRALPEFKTMQTQLEAYQKQYEDPNNTMIQAYQAEVKKANDAVNAKTMTDAQQTVEQGTLRDMQKRIQDFQADAQQKVE